MGWLYSDYNAILSSNWTELDWTWTKLDWTGTELGKISVRVQLRTETGLIITMKSTHPGQV